MTYIDLITYVNGQQKKIKYKEKSDMQKLIMQSWYTAVWQRTKTVPKLEEVLEDLNNSMEEDTDEKILKKVQKLQQKMGGGR